MTTYVAPNKPIVYVIHGDNKKNLVPALEWGSLEVVLPAEINPGPENIPHVIKLIRAGLYQYTDLDWLLLIGSPIAIAIGCAVAAQRTGGHVKLLKWDQQSGAYFPAVVNLRG